MQIHLDLMHNANTYLKNVVRNKGKKKKRFPRGSNPRPSACKADVITTTPGNHLTTMFLLVQF